MGEGEGSRVGLDGARGAEFVWVRARGKGRRVGVGEGEGQRAQSWCG